MSVPWEAQGLIETVFSLSLGGRKLSSYGRPLSAPLGCWKQDGRSAQTHGTESDTGSNCGREVLQRGGWWAGPLLYSSFCGSSPS